LGVDPIVIASQTVSALQTLVSRGVDVTREPAVFTVGTFHSGLRYNIVPDRAELTGTLRTATEEQRQRLMDRAKALAENVADGMGGRAEMVWEPNGYPPVINDAPLVERMAPSLVRAGGAGQVRLIERSSVGEDFSFFAQQAPGLFFLVGITRPGEDPARAPANHSPLFRMDEAALLVGLRAMLHLVADYTGSGTA
jgi:amidohydrolase